MTTTPFLSKSKYLSGLQCSKLLWHHYNAKDEIPKPDAATQAIFDQGHEVGALAKKLFPEGIEDRRLLHTVSIIVNCCDLLCQYK